MCKKANIQLILTRQLSVCKIFFCFNSISLLLYCLFQDIFSIKTENCVSEANQDYELYFQAMKDLKSRCVSTTFALLKINCVLDIFQWYIMK